MKYVRRSLSVFFLVILTLFLFSCGIGQLLDPECRANPKKCAMEFAITKTVNAVFPSEISKAILAVDTRKAFKKSDALQALDMTLTMMKKADQNFTKGFKLVEQALFMVQEDTNECKRKNESSHASAASGISGAIDVTDSKEQFQKVNNGTCHLRPEGKKKLNKGMLLWGTGSIYQIYTTLGLRALPDKFSGDAGLAAVERVVKTKRLGFTNKAAVIKFPYTVITWLKNTGSIVGLMYQLLKADSAVTGIDKKAQELARRKAKKKATAETKISISFYK